MKKIKRVVAFVLLSILLIPNANAGSLPNEMADITPLDRAYIYKCTSSACSSVSVSNQLISEEGTNFYTINNSSTPFTIDKYGVGVTNFVGILSPNILYNYELYLCSEKSFAKSVSYSIYTNFASSVGSAGYKSSYSYIEYFTLSTNIIKNSSESMTCDYTYAISSIFAPSKENTSFISNHFYASSSVSSVDFTVLGYKLEALGNYGSLSSSDIQNVIENSDIATATSIEEVETSLDEVKMQLESVKEETTKVNDTLNNDNVDDATSSANDFFSGFTSDDFGLTSIITAPLNLIQSITSSTCSPLALEVPFIENTTLNLPCLRSIYEKHFGSFLTIYQSITFGIVAYWVCIKIFNMVKDFKNPNRDEIEVLDL